MWVRWPLFVATALLAANICVLAARLTSAVAVTPWESAIALEAMRDGEWPGALRAGMQDELNRSRFLISVKTGVPSPLTPDLLTRNGFQFLTVPELHDSAYALWRRLNRLPASHGIS